MGVPVWGRNVIKLKDVSEEILHEHATHRAIRHARASVGARDAAHAVGHLWMMWQNIEKKGENDAEGQANKYMERVFQQKPIYEINSWDY